MPDILFTCSIGVCMTYVLCLRIHASLLITHFHLRNLLCATLFNTMSYTHLALFQLIKFKRVNNKIKLTDVTVTPVSYTHLSSASRGVYRLPVLPFQAFLCLSVSGSSLKSQAEEIKRSIPC